MSRKTCDICAETRAISKFITCPYCDDSVCVECRKQVGLGSVNPLACLQPACKKQFSDDFNYNNFPKSWMDGEYRVHQQNIMTGKELSLLTHTQPHLERILESEAARKEMNDVRWELEKLKARYEAIRIKVYNLENRPVEQRSVSIVCACPVVGCRGFVSNRNKCGVCDVSVCGKCQNVKNDEHQCKEDELKSVEEMEKTCRNCPNCTARIFKTEGCDQMWCTQCHVAFNWRTGKIEKGVIHNPEYFKYIRENGGVVPRNPNEVQCGGMPAVRNLGDRRIALSQIPVIEKYGRRYKSGGVLIADIYQKVSHFQQVVLPSLPTAVDNETNLDLRIKYMRKEIDKEKFTQMIYRRHKDRKKKIEYRDVLEMYCSVTQDLFYRLFENYDVPRFLAEEERVATFAMESIERLNKKYNSKMQVLVM